jgi:carbon storage regulator CsrA
MLIVSRTIGEEIVVPQHNLVFKILDICGKRVRVGISAPADVLLYRSEVWKKDQDLLATGGTVAHRHPQKSAKPV